MKRWQIVGLTVGFLIAGVVELPHIPQSPVGLVQQWGTSLRRESIAEASKGDNWLVNGRRLFRAALQPP